MAEPVITLIGSAQSKTTGTTLAIPVTAGVSVGQTVIVCFAVDPGSQTTITVTDNATGGSNTYTQRAMAVQGSGTSGVRTFIATATVARALTTANSITVTYASSAARAGSTFAATNLNNASLLDVTASFNGSAGAWDGTLTTVTPETLIIAAGGTDGIIGDIFNNDLAYTPINRIATAGSTATTNIAIQGGVRYVTRADAYKYVTVTTTRNYALAMVALKVTTGSQTVFSGQVQATVETASLPGTGDVADDMAIWVHPTDGAQSAVIAVSKHATSGGLFVYNMAGTQVATARANVAFNNIDLCYNFPLSGVPTDIICANNVTGDSLEFFTIDPSTKALTQVGSFLTGGASIYGLCLHRSTTGKYYAFVTQEDALGNLRQFELSGTSGSVTGTMVREFNIGSLTEGLVCDDTNDVLYAGQETVGIWRYSTDPTTGSTRTQVAAVSTSRLVSNVEGLSIYYGANGTGYLLASSQGSNTIAVYSRATGNAYLGSFNVVGSGTVDAVTQTDGLDVTNRPLGTGFTSGMLTVQDGSDNGGTTTNYKYVPWANVAALGGLITDTTFDSRQTGVVSGPNGNVIASFKPMTADATAARTIPAGGVPVTVTFQQGDANGYTGCIDTFLSQNLPDTRNDTSVVLASDTDEPTGEGQWAQPLIQFTGIFGTGPGQVPPGATIVSATLDLVTTNVGGSSINTRFHRVLIPWDATATWNSVGGGIQADGTKAVATEDFNSGIVNVLAPVTLTVTNSIQAWHGGANNYGWAGIPQSSNGWDVSSSDAATVADRPKLTINYETASDPAKTGAVASSLGALAATAAAARTIPTRSGAGSSSLAALSAAAVAARTIPTRSGLVASSIQALSATAVASRVIPTRTGAVSSGFPALSATSTASRTIPTRSGAASSSFAPLSATSAASRTIPTRSGAVASGLQAMSASATASRNASEKSGAVASSFGALSATAAASRVIPGRAGAVASSLSPLSATAVAARVIPTRTGAVASSFAVLSATATAARTIPTRSGDATASLGKLSADAVAARGIPTRSGAVGSTFAALAADASASRGTLDPKTGAIASSLAALSAAAQAARSAPVGPVSATATFQQGVGGYTGAIDTTLYQHSPDTRFDAAVELLADTDQAGSTGLPNLWSEPLLRFSAIFGTADGQVPPDATITSATLDIVTTDAGSGTNGGNFHRILIPWDGTATWNSVGGGIQADNVDAVSTVDFPAGSTNVVGAKTLTVTNAVTAWFGGANNYGWAVIPTSTNGWGFASSEATTVANRPKLTINYEYIPDISRQGAIAATFGSMAAAAVAVRGIPSGTSAVASSFKPLTAAVVAARSIPSRQGNVGTTFGRVRLKGSGTTALPTTDIIAASSLKPLIATAVASRTIPLRSGAVASSLPALTTTAAASRVNPARSGTVAASFGKLSATAAAQRSQPPMSGNEFSTDFSRDFAGGAGPWEAVAQSTFGKLDAIVAASRDAPGEVSATAAATFKPLSATATASRTIPNRTGAVAASFGKLSASSTAARTIPGRAGAVASSLKPLAAASTAVRAYPNRTGAVVSSFGKLSAASTASRIPAPLNASVAASFSRLTANAAAFRSAPGEVTSVIAATFKGLSASATAARTIPTRTATAAASFGKLSASSAAVRIPPAKTVTVAASLGKLSAAATAARSQPDAVSGTIASSFKPLTASATASRTIPDRTGNAAASFKKLSATVGAYRIPPPVAGDVNSSFKVLRATADAIRIPPPVSSDVAASFGAMSADGSAVRFYPGKLGVAASSFAPMSGDAIAVREYPSFSGDIASSFKRMTAAAAAQARPDYSTSLIGGVFVTGIIDRDIYMTGIIDADIHMTGVIDL